MLQNDIKVIEREQSEYDISLDHWKRSKPHGISGCFRLKDEGEFMVQAVESHLVWLDEAVLVVQKSIDNTIELAHDLARKYPDKVRVYYYPFNVYKIDTFAHYTTPDNSVMTMAHLTNWAMYMCQYSWIAKIEGDVIALTSFDEIRRAVDEKPDILRYYGRIGLNIAGHECNLFSATYPRNAGWDEGVFNNNPYWHCIRNDKWETINFHEHRNNIQNMGFSFLHTQRCKNRVLRVPYDGDDIWMPFNREHVERSLKIYSQDHTHPGPDNFCPDVLFEVTILDGYKRVIQIRPK